jgi:hypothetical protein
VNTEKFEQRIQELHKKAFEPLYAPDVAWLCHILAPVIACVCGFGKTSRFN